MNDLPLQLLHDYNDYLVRTAHHKKLAQTKRIARRRVTRENIAVMTKLVAWCATNEVDPRVWLHSLFAARFWTYAPPFNQLCSAKHLPRFRTEKRSDAGFFSNRVQRELNEQASPDAYDPNRDMTATVENAKRHYLDSGQPAVCMENMTTMLGFHPRSLVCARCPLAQACGQKLQAMVPFDIMALRRGEITAEHARHLAMLHGSRS